MAYSNPNIPTVNIITMNPENTLIIHGACKGTPPTGAAYAGIFALECLMTDEDGVGIYEMTGTVAVPAWTLISSGATGDQSAIQFQDEGTNLGTAGTVVTENYVGGGVTATRAGNIVTVTIPGGAGGGSVYSTGDANNFATLAATAATFTNAGTTVATGDTGETTLTGTVTSFGTGSDTGTAAPYATAVTDTAALWAQLKALTGTAIVTPGTFDTREYTPGIYTTASAITSPDPTVITLNGDGDYVFVSTGGAITFGANTSIVLTNGASAARIFWVANNAITTGSTNTLYGNFLSGPTGDITIGSTNIIQGRLLSGKAIIIDGTATALALPLGASGTSGVALADNNMFVGSPAGVAIPTPVSHVVKYAGTLTWSGGGATLAPTVTGVAATDIVLATVKVAATETGYIASVIPTTDTLTFTLSTANTSNDAVIYYTVLRAI